MKCTLCGFEFSERDAKRPCAGCPWGAKCDLVCCPNCGYQAPREPHWLRRLRLWRQHNGVYDGTLAALRPGAVSEIIAVRSRDEKVLHKLTALGLLPGVRVRVLRRFPCYLLELGHAQVALDRELALAILVRPDSPSPLRERGTGVRE